MAAEDRVITKFGPVPRDRVWLRTEQVRRQRADGMTLEAVADHHRVTMGTIRKILAATGGDPGLDRKLALRLADIWPRLAEAMRYGGDMPRCRALVAEYDASVRRMRAAADAR